MAHPGRRAVVLVVAAVLGVSATVAAPAAVAATSRFYTSDPAGDAHSPPGSDGPSDPRFDVRSVRATRYDRDIYGVVTFTDLKPASFWRYQVALTGTNQRGGVIELRQAARGPATTAYYDLRPGTDGSFAATQVSCSGAFITERTAPNKISFDIPTRCFTGRGDQLNVIVRSAKWSQGSWQPGRLRSYPGPDGAITADAVYGSWR